jgi:2-polyprenyl-3-methyl-5-hydroxy-6-metoxy-1,4-benzoquinol methylase
LYKPFLRIINEITRLFSPCTAHMRDIVITADSYNMVEEENEKFFSQIYTYHINNYTNSVGGSLSTILDAGCGQGRLSMAFARAGGKVLGIDLSSKAIQAARKYAAQERLAIDFTTGDLSTELKKLPDSQFDAVVCTEVLYMLDNYILLLDELYRILKPGGCMFISLRPRFYYIMHAIRNACIGAAKNIAAGKSNSFKNLNCHSIDDIKHLLNRYSLINLEYYGIGVVSGIAGDPQASCIQPSGLDTDDQKMLLDIEISLGQKFCENGRYILLCAQKPKSESEV